MDAQKELINQVYDNLFGNVGMSEFHTPFPVNEIKAQEIDERAGIIRFEYQGTVYILKISKMSAALKKLYWDAGA